MNGQPPPRLPTFSRELSMRIHELYDRANDATLRIREDARVVSLKAMAGRGAVDALTASGSATSSSFGGTEEAGRALRQYAAYRDTAYTAIRPIAVRIAGQPIRAGVSITPVDPDGPRIRKKELSIYNQQAKMLAPSFIAKSIDDSVDVLPTHPIIDLLENPNPYMTGWANMYCSVVSLYCTGRFIWWFDQLPDGGEHVYYIPSSWATPKHDGRPFTSWNIRPPGVTTGFDVDAENIFFCHKPDPGNPLDSLAPLQTQAKAVNTEDKIQGSQYAVMANQARPGMVLVAGQMPNVQGQPGQRPVLTPAQRKQLITAIQMVYRGVQQHGEPIILDGLIENVYPYTRSPAEMDFMGGSKLTKERIMQGIGTSPVIAGQSENVNRATSYAQHEIFYDNTVNPDIDLISQSLTMRVARRARYSQGNERLHIWIEKAEPNDPDLALRRVAVGGKDVMTKGDMRRWIATGKLNHLMQPRDDDDEPVMPPRPVNPTPQAGQPSKSFIIQN